MTPIALRCLVSLKDGYLAIHGPGSAIMAIGTIPATFGVQFCARESPTSCVLLCALTRQIS